MDRGSPEPGGVGGGVACQHLGKRVWLRLYVCVCECASVCVSVCVCHTDTILSTLAERGDTNGGGKKRRSHSCTLRLMDRSISNYNRGVSSLLTATGLYVL